MTTAAICSGLTCVAPAASETDVIIACSTAYFLLDTRVQ